MTDWPLILVLVGAGLGGLLIGYIVGWAHYERVVKRAVLNYYAANSINRLIDNVGDDIPVYPVTHG